MQGSEQTKRPCDWQDCPEAGVHRAPKSPDELENHYWFCLDHVRQYNSQWDYFKDKTAEEIERFRRNSILGHRPTWRMDSGVKSHDWATSDPLDLLHIRPGVRNPFEPAARRAARARLSTRELRALEKLGLDETASANDIKKRFKTLVKRYHPDSNGGRGAEDRLKQILQAYSDLKGSGRLAAQKA